MNTQRTWRTSSYSGPNNNCVELAPGRAETAIRDTKDRAGGTLVIGSGAFAALLGEVKAGRHGVEH